LAIVTAALLGGLLLADPSTRADGDASEWPPLRPGVWEQASTNLRRSRRTLKYARPVCHDTRVMFWRYSGAKEVGIGGCAFQSKRLSADTYRIVARCDVRGGGESETLVTVKSADEFAAQVTTQEGGELSHSTMSGRRIGDCKQREDRGP
jgi:hypothetical protein